MKTDIIINADDFGAESNINSAIIKSFEKGYVNSATIMANMPGFEEAVELAHKSQITNNLGVHLVLNEGEPITTGLKSLDMFSSNSEGRSMFPFHQYFRLSGNDKKLIYKEFAAQIERVRKNNIEITHLDTHHHVHELIPILNIVLRLLKEYHIPSVRILNNLLRSTAYYKKMYRRLINFYLSRRNVNFTDFFGDQLDFTSAMSVNSKDIRGKKIEVMVHPTINSSGDIRDKVGPSELDFSFVSLI
jgi:predicted glycoside hydrolase/deacetylase ChbG (UPF0249 family)